MKRVIRRIAILMVITLLAPTFLSFIPSLDKLTAEEVSAETIKAELGYTEATIGISSSPEYIYLKSQNYDAVYSFTSANPKIATVNEYGMISGVAKGKTTVTVKETYKEKTTTVGKMSINVVGPKIEVKSMGIGVNSGNYASISYLNFSAVYSYKSSDTKTVKIDEYGYISGLKPGKATVSVTEKYNGKTTKIGSITVNVVSGKLSEKEILVPVTSYATTEIPIDCMNPKAVYKYKSADSKIAKVGKDGSVTGVTKGTTTISVTETYNKKTVKLGSITVKVVGASIDPTSKAVDIGINSTNTLTSIVTMNYMNGDAIYTCESSDSSVVWAGYDESGWYFQLKGAALGTATITIYEEYKGEKTKIGTVKVTVKEIPVTDFYFWMEETNGEYVRTYYLDEFWGEDLTEYFYKEPYNATSPVTYTSSDETVVTVDEKGTLTPLAEGEAEITITCGKFTNKFKAIVKASETNSEDTETSEDLEDGSGDGSETGDGFY